MTDAEVVAIKGMFVTLASLRHRGAPPTPAQSLELSLIGQATATDAVLAAVGVALQTTDHGSAYLGYLCIKLASFMAEAHPDGVSTADTLRHLAAITADSARTAEVPVTSLNNNDKGSN